MVLPPPAEKSPSRRNGRPPTSRGWSSPDILDRRTTRPFIKTGKVCPCTDTAGLRPLPGLPRPFPLPPPRDRRGPPRPWHPPPRRTRRRPHPGPGDQGTRPGPARLGGGNLLRQPPEPPGCRLEPPGKLPGRPGPPPSVRPDGRTPCRKSPPGGGQRRAYPLGAASTSGAEKREVRKVDLKKILENLGGTAAAAQVREEFFRNQSFSGVVPLLESIRQRMTVTGGEEIRWEGKEVSQTGGRVEETVEKRLPRRRTGPLSCPGNVSFTWMPRSPTGPTGSRWWGPAPSHSTDLLLIQTEFGRNPRGGTVSTFPHTPGRRFRSGKGRRGVTGRHRYPDQDGQGVGEGKCLEKRGGEDQKAPSVIQHVALSSQECRNDERPASPAPAGLRRSGALSTAESPPTGLRGGGRARFRSIPIWSRGRPRRAGVETPLRGCGPGRSGAAAISEMLVLRHLAGQEAQGVGQDLEGRPRRGDLAPGPWKPSRPVVNSFVPFFRRAAP